MQKITSAIVFALLTACNGVVVDDTAVPGNPSTAGAANVAINDGQDDSVDAGQPETEPVKPVQGTGGQATAASTGGSISATGGSQSTGGSLVIAATGGNQPAGTAGAAGNSVSDTDAGVDGNAGGSHVTVQLAEDTPQTRIVVSGHRWGDWYVFSEYVVKNPGDMDKSIAYVIVQQSSPGGTFADFTDIHVSVCAHGVMGAPGTVIRAEGSYIDSQYANTEAHLSDSDSGLLFRLDGGPAYFTIPAHGELRLCLTGLMAETKSDAEDALTPERDPKSGDTPGLRIATLSTMNADSATEIVQPNDPPTMLLRKAAPFITWRPIAEPLHVGINAIVKLEVSNASSINPLALQQLMFDITSGGGVEYEIIPDPENVTNYPFGMYAFWLDGNVSPGSVFLSWSQPNYGVFTFNDGDRLVTGAGPMLIEGRVNVTSAPSGSWIETKLQKTPQLDSYDGFVYQVGAVGPNFMTVVKSAGDLTELSSSVIWSDLSAGAEHVPYASPGNSSSDYLTSYLVDGIDGSAKITAP